MLSTFEQVRDWITDNGLKRWMLFKDYTLKEKFLDSAAFPGSQDDKIAMTEKYLRSVANGRAYAKGGTSAGQNDLDMCAEIRLEERPQNVQGIGGEFANIGELRDTIAKQVRAEIKAEQYEEERKRFEQEKREFQKEKESGMGALLHLLAPVGQALMSKSGLLSHVAGVDTETPTEAQPIKPIETENPEGEGMQEAQEAQEASVYDEFTEKEGEEIFSLMSRFRKVEPDCWLKMIRKVVDMAESGDSMYNIARGVLAQ